MVVPTGCDNGPVIFRRRALAMSIPALKSPPINSRVSFGVVSTRELTCSSVVSNSSIVLHEQGA